MKANSSGFKPVFAVPLLALLFVFLWVGFPTGSRTDEFDFRAHWERKERMTGSAPCQPKETLEFFGQSNPKLANDKQIDEYVYSTFFNNPPVCGGSFLDLGANTGTGGDNTYFFEKFLGWRGTCVEGNPTLKDVLAKARPVCQNVFAGLAARTGKPLTYLSVKGLEVLGGFEDFMDADHLKRFDRERQEKGEEFERFTVPTLGVTDLLNIANTAVVELVSLDIEGAEELFLENIDFSRLTVGVWVIEHNGRSQQERSTHAVLSKQGYRRVVDPSVDFFNYNLVYVHPSLYPKTVR